MSKSGPIIYIEDDVDDREFFEEAIRELKISNRVLTFPDTDGALDYLSGTPEAVFAIFCDINLPRKNGLDFKKRIDANPVLKRKCIPFIFFSTSANKKDVNDAYDEITIQGFFKKPSDFNDLKVMLRTIFDYWRMCKHPNTTF